MMLQLSGCAVDDDQYEDLVNKASAKMLNDYREYKARCEPEVHSTETPPITQNGDEKVTTPVETLAEISPSGEDVAATAPVAPAITA